MIHPDIKNAPEGAFIKVFPDDVIHFAQPTLPKVYTYIGYCCREWVMAFGAKIGTCGYCGERPTFLREDGEDA